MEGSEKGKNWKMKRLKKEGTERGELKRRDGEGWDWKSGD